MLANKSSTQKGRARMGNYENIRPYSNMNHDASKAGGVAAFKQMYYNHGFAAGVMSATQAINKPSIGKQLLWGVGIIGIYETGKYAYRTIKKHISQHIECMNIKAHDLVSHDAPVIITSSTESSGTAPENIDTALDDELLESDLDQAV